MLLVRSLRNGRRYLALRAIKLFQTLPNKPDALILGKQLLRSATSVAANNRAACRARSAAEFAAKAGIVVEEADESLFWLEVLEESGVVPANLLVHLKKEADEITTILTSIRKSSVKKKQLPNS